MALALPGVFSGIDTEALIARLMALNRRPLNMLEERKAQWQAKQSALADIESRLTTLKTQADGLRDAQLLRTVFATTSDSSVATATAGVGVAEGTHQIVINRLATAEKLVLTTGLASATAPVGAPRSTALNSNGVSDPSAAWFTTTANGATYTFDFGTETDIDNVQFAASTAYSMNQVRDLINARSQAVAGYDAASVEYDSQSGLYYLRLDASGTGSVGTMTQTLTAGDAIDELNDEADWIKTDAGSGKFVYTYNGTTRTIHLPSGATLDDLRNLINSDGGNPGVNAGLLEYNNAYHLVLSGKDTGGDHAITIDNLQTTLNGFDADDFTRTQTAQNAQFRVDGFPADPNWLERASNAVTDVIPGVTLNLRNTGSVTVTLNRNTDDLQQNLENFVAGYNGLADAIGGYTGYDAETKTGGVLQGDTTVNSMLYGIRSDLTTTAPGFQDGVETYTLPGQIGFSFDRYGKLSLDTSALGTALSADYLGTLNLIGAKGSGDSDSDYIQFSSAGDNTQPGTYEVEVDFDASGNITQARIRAQGESAWRYMDIDGNTLVGATGNEEEGLVLTAVWDGLSGTLSAGVHVRQGFAGAIYDRLEEYLDEVSGVVATRKEHYDAAIANLDRNIELQEKRLETKEKYLREQYARMETILARLDSQRGAFESLINQLDASRKAAQK